ncbi:MAG TPA: hypothetical protein VFM25_01840 [Verrucomicrobiae bacterium]|nr:hypothetical protein [Verrucomicrobiae bacterium]
MNTHSLKFSSLGGNFRRLTLAASLLLAASVINVQAQFKSPVGTWDFVIGGSGESGIAFLTFSDEPGENGLFSFNGYEILAPKRTVIVQQNNNDDSGRGGTDVGRGGSDGRDGGTSGTNTQSTVISKTNLFGFSEIHGSWYYDTRGRVVGYFGFSIDGGPTGTNSTLNNVSFVGKVKLGKRMTLLATTTGGKLTYRGVPFRDLTDLSGSWNGYKTVNHQTFIEFFSLAPFDENIYLMNGNGATYSYQDGICMLSAHKKIGFAAIEVPNGSTNGVLRASVGSFVNNRRKTKAVTKGAEEPDTAVKFKATLAPPLP